MFIISLNYIESIEKVDALLESHVEFLKRQYDKQIFIASGRKVPRTGGVILARVKNKKVLNTIIAQDPFYKNCIAEYEVTEFFPSMTLPEYKSLIEV